jgi:hypothetical protein
VTPPQPAGTAPSHVHAARRTDALREPAREVGGNVVAAARDPGRPAFGDIAALLGTFGAL